jgi:PAS domain S-box-containing protein
MDIPHSQTVGHLKDRLTNPARGALLGAGLVFIVLLFSGWWVSQWYQARYIAELRSQITAENSLRANAVSASIHRRLALLEGLRAFVEAESDSPDFAEKFHIFSAGIFSSTPDIRNIAVSRGEVMQYVYPFEENQVVMGYNPFQDSRPEVRADALRAKEAGTTVLSGPNELVQGGIGLIARQAVYQGVSFWGLVNIVIDLPPILERAGLNEESDDIDIALRSSEKGLIYGPAEVFEEDPVIYRIDLPEGAWEIASLPKGGWKAAARSTMLIFQAGELLIILLVSSLAYLTINRQSLLAQTVRERTKEISRINEILVADIQERERVEASLKASEDRLASLLDVAPDAIIAINEDQDIVMFNKAAEKMFDYRSGEVLGHPLEVLLPAQYETTHRHHVRNFIDSPSVSQRMDERLPIWGRRKDGSDFPAEASISKLVTEGTTILTAIVRDISRRTETEAQLREREEQYRSIFESVNDALFITDMDTGEVVDFNPAASRMHGYTDEEFRQLEIAGFVHPDSRHIFQEYLRIVKAGGVFQGRAVDLRKDGSSFPIEVLGTTITYRGKTHILGVVRDISEEVRTYQLLEERVSKRTRELQTLLDISRNITSTLDFKSLLTLILDQLQTVVEFTSLAVWMQEEDGSLSMIEYQGPIPLEMRPQHWPQAGHQESAYLAEMGEPIIIPDIYEDTPLANAWRAEVIEMLGGVPPHVASWMGIPLIVNNRKIGHLTFHHAQPGYYTQQHADLAFAVANHAAIAIENARLYDEAQRLAALQERQKLARELHDSVSQALYGLALGTRTARQLLDIDPSRAAEPLEYCLSLAEAGLAEMRALIFELRPESLENEGLVAALKKQAAAVQARHDLNVEVEVCEEPDISLSQKEGLYRVAQEAMHNIVKHAGANTVHLQLFVESGKLSLVIIDDGTGFDPRREYPGHLGLKSMRERLERLQGSIDIRSEIGKGTTVRAWLDIDE